VNKTSIPKLVPLRFGNPYCAACRTTLHPGWLVAWWPTKRGRKSVHCAACHRDRVRVLNARRTREPECSMGRLRKPRARCRAR
jgi:hypothetical protein